MLREVRQRRSPAGSLIYSRLIALYGTLPSRMICLANHVPAAEGVAARTVAGGARGAGERAAPSRSTL
jgi:hypothetical protein